MRLEPSLTRGGMACVLLALATAAHAAAGPHAEHAGPAIPASIRAEHEHIHAELTAATKVPGRVGAAAKRLAAVLHPHFVREEQIALPPLGLLAPLAAGERVPEQEAAQASAMAASLRAELPRMLEEHEAIRAAVGELLAAARAERAPRQQRLAEALAAHARTEEEVLYPAAVLVGELLRGRGSPRPAGE